MMKKKLPLLTITALLPVLVFCNGFAWNIKNLARLESKVSKPRPVEALWNFLCSGK